MSGVADDLVPARITLLVGGQNVMGVKRGSSLVLPPHPRHSI